MTGTMRLDGVTIAVAGRVLVPPLDASVEPGQIVTIMGPSGSGKSSLLDLCRRLSRSTHSRRGERSCRGEPITQLRPEQRRVGILFQDDLLFPHLSVGENLAFGLRALMRPARPAGDRSIRPSPMLVSVGFAGRDPATLSGGQGPRRPHADIARRAPRALLLDEPFGKLDEHCARIFAASPSIMRADAVSRFSS